jgi:hypothetical protein
LQSSSKKAAHEGLAGGQSIGTLALFAGLLERDPEKWVPVFRKDHAQTKS